MTHRTLSLIQAALMALNYALAYLTPAAVRNLAQVIKRALRPHGLAVCLALLLPAPALSQSVANAETQPATAGAALSPESIELQRAGNAALYNIDYAGARAKFEELRRRLPQHPAGDLYLATTIWLEHLNRSRRLQTSLYQDDSSFFAGAEKAKEETEGDAVDAAVDRAFRERMAQAKAKALALVNRDKKDPDALYYLGAVYGVMAGYEASTARKFFAAMRNGSRSVDYHQRVVKLRPDYYDAYLSIGMYDYIVGNLPFALKAIAALGGIHGSKSRGIRELQQVVDKGVHAADDARIMLIAIYQNERRPDDALALLQHLSAKYPRSYLLKLETASMLVQLNRSAEAYAVFDELVKDARAASALDLIHYQYAEALAKNNDYDRAIDHFIAVTRAKGADQNLATVALLRAGQVYDISGKRSEAVAQYQAVLGRPNIYDTREQAERGIKRPFRDKEKKREPPKDGTE